VVCVQRDSTRMEGPQYRTAALIVGRATGGDIPLRLHAQSLHSCILQPLAADAFVVVEHAQPRGASQEPLLVEELPATFGARLRAFGSIGASPLAPPPFPAFRALPHPDDASAAFANASFKGSHWQWLKLSWAWKTAHL